jgi:hypothetical protein
VALGSALLIVGAQQHQLTSGVDEVSFKLNGEFGISSSIFEDRAS